MELLPIIYTTLMIFAGLALITIIISYVLFKVRKSAAPDETKATQKPATPPQIKKVSSQYPKTKLKTTGSDEKIIVKTGSYKEKKIKTSSEEKQYRKEKKKPVKPRKDRIEILNKTQNEDTFPSGLANRSGSGKIKKNEPEDKNRSTTNFFDNYDEDRDDTFHPLS